MSATSQAKACVFLGQIQVHMEALESLPYRPLTVEQVDMLVTAARSLKRVSESLLTEIENLEEA